MNIVGWKSLETQNVCHLWVHLKTKVPKGEDVEMQNHVGFHKEAFCDSCEEYYNNVKKTFHYIETFVQWKHVMDAKGSSWNHRCE